MIERTFVDTNLLIYAYDRDAGRKRTVAAAILQDLWKEAAGVLSTQVLQEFYVNATRKLARPLPRAQARQVVDAYSPWCVPVTFREVSAAFQIEDAAAISFWDALVVASAAHAGAVRLLSEDLSSGQSIAGVRIENPLIPPR